MAAAERQEAARKYAQDIVEAVRDGLIVLDGDLRVRSVNDAYFETLRLPPKNIAGQCLDDHLGLPEPVTVAVRRLVQELREDATSRAFRLEHIDQGGASVAVVLEARRIAETELFLIRVEDVTEIERATSQRAERGFRAALASAAEAIVMADTSGRILFSNPAAVALFGYEEAELGRMGLDSILPDHIEEAYSTDGAPHPAAPASRRSGMDRDLVGRRKDGTEFPIDVSVSALTQEGGRVAVVFVTDVTQRRRAEQDIAAYQARLQGMAFDAAVTEERERRRIALELHDSIGQDLALAQIKLAPLHDEHAGHHWAAVDQTVQLLDKVIHETATLVFALSPPVLYDLGLKEAVAWLAEDVEKRHGLKIKVHDDGLDTPLDDAARGVVYRAVREVVMNVVKHSKAPAANVSIDLVDRRVRVVVQDHGIGFDADGPAERTSPGGFGLLSVREQVTRLGGKLTVVSAPERGTTVSIVVPLRASEPPVAPSEPSAEGKEGAR